MVERGMIPSAWRASEGKVSIERQKCLGTQMDEPRSLYLNLKTARGVSAPSRYNGLVTKSFWALVIRCSGPNLTVNVRRWDILEMGNFDLGYSLNTM